MWFLSEDSVELLRSAPLLLVVLCLGTVSAKHDFPVYRMQHFDIHGVHFGSRSAAVNMEMRGEGVAMLNRKCVIVRWAWLNPDRFLDLVHKGAGSILILLPVDWRSVSDQNITDKWIEVEEKLLAMDVPIPVYFATETDELADIHAKMAAGADSEWGSSAAAALLSSVAGQGYQAVADASDPVVLQHHEVVSFVGKLGGAGTDRDLPTVAIVTHYDAFGLAPALSTGPDSNGSGVAALLELARLFSLLYSDPLTKPSYNMMFVLTGGGHLGYFGTKYFIEDMLEDDDSFLLSKADYVLCLDSIAAINSSDLFVHLSRPPANTSRAHHLLQHVNMSAAMLSPSMRVNIVHKKVRIGAGEELVAWEHERFSLRRIPAATISSLSSHTDSRRKAMFHQVASSAAVANTVRVLAEGIARHIMDLPDHQDDVTPIFSGSLDVKERYVSAWLGHLSTSPRSPQLLDKDHPVLTSLEETLSEYVDQVTKFSHTPADKSDPEYVLYNVPSTTMHVHSVKPAVFDLVLALSIAGYSALVYLLVGHFTEILQLLAPLLTLKIKTE